MTLPGKGTLEWPEVSDLELLSEVVVFSAPLSAFLTSCSCQVA